MPESAAAPMEGRGELVGIVVALLVLVLTLGSVVGAGLPIGTALVGLGIGSAGITLLAAATDVSTAAPMVATMVGLGVGIDYALLLLTRHAEYLAQGMSIPEAAGRATATAGRSVVFAASTVLVSLMGLRLAGLPVFSSFGFATAIVVLCVMAASLTLVPALSRLAGRRLLPRRTRARSGRVHPDAVHRALGGPGRQPTGRLGGPRLGGHAHPRRPGARHAALAAGPEQPVDRAHHPPCLRPGQCRVRLRAATAP